MTIDDTTLTRDETDLITANNAASRVLLLACGAIAREVLDIIKINAWSHIDLKCLPAILHNSPEKITPAVTAAVRAAQGTYAHIYVLYADCGTGGLLQQACDKMGVEMLRGPHCYSFFQGNDSFAQSDDVTAFYLTDFLARQFDAFVWKPLGLDRFPDLRDMYFGNYTKLVYQSQTDDPALVSLAQDHATKLGLAFEHRPTGYGDLQNQLRDWI
jgi:hypothetical protein